MTGERWLYHAVDDAPAWSRARETGLYSPQSFIEGGFIHLCTSDQLVGVAERWFPDRRQLDILLVDSARLAEEALRWERAPAGVFPHLYGPLSTNAVVREVRWTVTSPVPRTEPDQGKNR